MGTTPPFDPRSAARQARDYAKAQRSYWRYYYRGSCRRSIVRPIILIVIGVIALLVETGRISVDSFWLWYGRWWPVLLIGLGVLLLLEYLFDRKNPYAGRGAGGIIWLVIIVALIGWSVHGAQTNWNWFGPDSGSFWNMVGPQYNHTVQLDQALHLPPGVKPIINIENPRGDVMVMASTDGMIHLRGHQVAHTGSQSHADSAFAATTPQIDLTSSGANIVVPSKDNLSDDLTLEIPAAAGVIIQSSQGDVTVEGLNGSVDVTAQHGDVRVDRLGANVHAKMENGDFSAHNVKGHALVEGSGGDITLSGIGGDASIHGEFTGDVHLQNVSGAVTFQSSRTQISVPHLVGEMTLDSGDLGMDRASGPIVIKAQAKNMDLSAMDGDVQIQDSDGNVNLSTGLPMGAITVQNRTGSIRLEVPQNASFHIAASTSSNANIDSDFPLTASTDNETKTLTGQVGRGGPQINLTTTHGSVEISKGPAATPGAMQSHVPHFTSSQPIHATVQ